MSRLKSCSVVVVGATGAVGREMLSILAERGISKEAVTALGSVRSAGRSVPYGADSLVVEESSSKKVEPGSVCLLAVGADTARELAARFVSDGALVVDNSSAFRADDEVPLCIPEVNGALLASPEVRLVANPNCSTILLAVALSPLLTRFGMKEVIVSTYQAASGAGQAAMDELQDQARAVLAGNNPEPQIFPEPCAFNVFPHESDMDVDTGWNGEERKMISEMRRIFEDETFELNPTCVRVPVLRAHSQSVFVTLGQSISEEQVRSAFDSAPGLRVLDDRVGGKFPTPLRASGKDDVLVGRLRSPGGAKSSARWNLWLSGDQLRKGAALNAIQCAERWLETRDQ